MNKYLCFQRDLPGASSKEQPSPQQMQEMYVAFQTWQSKFHDQLVDMGGRLGGGKLITDGSVVDGPFVELKELVGGYMIIQAASIDEAAGVAKGCPGLVGPGSGVEIIEILSQ